MTTKVTTKAPAAAGADATAAVLVALSDILRATDEKYASGGDELARRILFTGGIYSPAIEQVRRRVLRRTPSKARDLDRLPAILEVGRRLASAKGGAR